MAISIRPYTEEFTPAVKQFNRRLVEGGVAEEFLFPENHVSDWLPKAPTATVYQEYYVATEDSTVRGAYILKHQQFALNGQEQTVGFYRLPLSEGIVSKAYTSVGVQMLKHALKIHPMIFAMGMGGFTQPLPLMLKAMGWSMQAVPFFFRVNHPARFAMGMSALRTTPLKRLIMNIGAATGGAWAGLNVLQKLRARARDRSVTVERINQFSGWADKLWQDVFPHYVLIAVRSSEVLNRLYCGEGSHYHCIKVLRRGEVIGWAALYDTQMNGDKYFGNLRLGSVVDCLAKPGDETAVIQACVDFLEERGVDLTVSNQTHSSWCAAFKNAGFIQGPSDFVLASSKKLSEVVGTLEKNFGRIHLTRGDGDGPLRLISGTPAG